MLPMVGEGNQRWTVSCNNRLVKASNKYINDYDPNKQSSSQRLGCKQFIWLGNFRKFAY